MQWGKTLVIVFNGVLHIPLGYEWLLKVNKNVHTKAENFFLAHKRTLVWQSESQYNKNSTNHRTTLESRLESCVVIGRNR